MSRVTDTLGLEKDSGYGKSNENRLIEAVDKAALEFRTDDPNNPKPRERWFRTDLGVERFAVEESNGSISVKEKRSVFNKASFRVVEDFEGKTMSNLQALSYVTADQQIAQQNGSERLEVTAAQGEFGGVYWSEQTDEVAATAYIPDENSNAGVTFTDSDGDTEAIIAPDFSGSQAPEPSIFLFDIINNQPIDTVTVTPSNWIGGDVEFSLRLDGDGNVIGEATDINGDTTTLSGSAPAGLSKAGYGVQVQKSAGSGESKIYIDDVKAFDEGQEVSTALSEYARIDDLSEYARIDAVPDAYINSGQGVVDNGSGLEVAESEVDHDGLNNYASEEHHPVFVQSTIPPAKINTIWVDISQNPPKIKRFDGETWQNTGAEVSTHDNTAHSETYALYSDVVTDHANLNNVETDQHHTRPSAGTGLDEGSSNNFRAGETPTNLSGVTGDFNGQIRIDDGTNSAHGGVQMCVWNGSAWIDQSDGSSFS